MRYYATCIDAKDEELLIIVKGDTEKEAMRYLKSKYKVNKVVRFKTTPPPQEKNYYASLGGVHQGRAIIRRSQGRRGNSDS